MPSSAFARASNRQATRPLLARGGPAFDVAAAAARIEDDLARHQLWCPTTPAIRAQCREHAAGLALSALDLQPLEPIPAWRVERAPGSGRRPILGRMLRPDDDRLPAGRETLLAAYPTQPGLEMRFLGGELIAPKKKH
jgi:hypothetical protein